MLTYKDTKLKDEKTDQTIKALLNIRDKNISFPNHAISTEQYKGRKTVIITGRLSYKPKRCANCGIENDKHTIILHSPKVSHITLLPIQGEPAVLRLYKQRFKCKNCQSTFSAKTYYVNEHCYLSRTLLFAIAHDLKKKISMTDIAHRYFVSIKTVERVLETFFEERKNNFNYLPKHLMIDEFKGTRDCEGNMCFIVCDADTGAILDILDDRRNFKLEKYFMKYSFKARRSVKHVVMDMNAAYESFTKGVFPNAKIIIDRFHIIQQITRAFNQVRIRTMNELNQNKSEERKHYTKLKKYWKTLLKKGKKISYDGFKQFPLFQRKFMTESEVLDYLLSIDATLKSSYEVYQELLLAFEEREVTTFFEILEQLPIGLDEGFKKAITSLLKHKKGIALAFEKKYSNGKIEGKNNLIKVLKRIAFGFRKFKNLKMRVMVQQGIFQIV
jgi:transposase